MARSDPFSALRKRKRALLARLAASPLVDVLGVVMPHYGFGCWDADDKKATFIFSFGAWRVEGRRVKAQELTIRRNNLTDNAVLKIKGALPEYTVVRIRARVLPTRYFGTRQAFLEKIVGPDDSDDSLNAFAAELKKPVTRDDRILGTLTLDRALDWFAGKASWRGHQVSVYLQTKDLRHFQKALRAAHSLWKAQAAWDRRVREFAVQELLELKNERWLSEGESKVTARQFKERMRLTSISVSPDGSFEFSHDDGDLFWDHEILVKGRLSKGLTGATISG